jgi:hypothetical protein
MVQTWFLVTVGDDGSLVSYNQIPEDLPKDTRPANNWDIYQAAKQIVEEFELQKLADRVAATVVGTLNPPVQKVSDTIAEALKERGINPESVSTDA